MLAWLIISGAVALTGFVALLLGGLSVLSAANKPLLEQKTPWVGIVATFSAPILVWAGLISAFICGVVWLVQAVTA